MAVTKFGKNEISDINNKLKSATDVTNEAHLKIIEDTSKDLFDILGKTDTYAEVKDHEADLKDTLKLLKERKEALEKKENLKKINAGDIQNGYNAILSPAPVDADAAEKADANTKGAEIEGFYKEFQSLGLITNLPADFTTIDLYDQLRNKESIDTNGTGIKELEDKRNVTPPAIPGALTAIDIANIITQLKDGGKYFHLDASITPDIEGDVAKLLVIFSQLHLFYLGRVKKLGGGFVTGWDQELYKEQYTLIKNYHNIISKAIKTLKAHKNTSKAISSVDKRITNLDKLEKTNPYSLGDITPNKTTPIAWSTLGLKDAFLEPGKLTEEQTGYEIGEITLKDKNNKNVELFEDAAGTKKLTKTLKPGDPSVDIFIKDTTGTGKKIGKMELTGGAHTSLAFELESYENLPDNLDFPTKLEIKATGVGGEGGLIEDKAGITKTLTINLLQPDFGPEYDSLLVTYPELDNQFDKIFNENYEAQLRDMLDEMMKNDPLSKGERNLMSPAEKEHFFKEVIMKNVAPAWAGVLYIPDINKTNNCTPAEFKAMIKKFILAEFKGKTLVDLKKFLFEKLGRFDFTELNPKYIIHLLPAHILAKYKSKSGPLHLLLDAYLLGVRTTKTINVPAPKIAAVKEINSVVAESTEVNRDAAYKKAMKEMEDDYKGSAKWSIKRAKIFFFRESIINKKVEKDLRKNKGLNMGKETSSATNRWMLEKAMGGEFAKHIVEETTVFNDPVFQSQLDKIVYDYLLDATPNADVTFEAGVQALIMSNTELRDMMKKHKITHLGTNVVEQAKSEKAERGYYQSFIDLINQYAPGGALNLPQEFDKKSRALVAKFAKEQNKLPDMMKELKLKLDDINFATKLATHKTALQTMMTRTVKIRLNLLRNLSEESKGLRTAQDVNVNVGGKLTKFMMKHPRMTTGVTVLGLVGTGIAGALTTPLIGLGGGAALLYYINFLKKKGHYTQEHKKFEEQLLKMTPNERDTYLEEMKDKSEKMPKWMRRVFPSRYNKYAETMEYFNRLDSAENTLKRLQNYTNKAEKLQAAEKIAFRGAMTDAASLLKLHKEEGRNFTYGEKGQQKLEELYNELHKSLIAGMTRMYPTRNPEQAVNQLLTYTPSTKVTDTVSEYEDSMAKMRSMRTKLGVMAGLKSAGIYVGSAFALGWLKTQIADGRNHLFGSDSANTAMQGQGRLGANTLTTGPTSGPTGTTTGIGLDPAFGLNAAGAPDGHLLLNNIFDGDVSKYNAFVSKMGSLPVGDNSTTLWGTLKDIYGTDALANAKTHDFFNQFAANITDSTGNELVRLGTLGSVSPVNAISSKMIARGYNGMVTNPSDIQSLLDGLRSGTYSLNSLPVGWTKETASNVLFCNTYGHELKDLIFDNITSITRPPVGPLPHIHLPLPLAESSAGGVTDYFLPAGVPTVWNEVNKFETER